MMIKKSIIHAGCVAGNVHHLVDVSKKETNMDFIFFFFNDTAPTEFYPLPLHAALPIYPLCQLLRLEREAETLSKVAGRALGGMGEVRVAANRRSGEVAGERDLKSALDICRALRIAREEIGRAHV